MLLRAGRVPAYPGGGLRSGPLPIQQQCVCFPPRPKPACHLIDLPPLPRHRPWQVGRLNLQYACCTQAGLTRGQPKENQVRPL